jgi:hypothetical protein
MSGRHERHWRIDVEGFLPITTSELTIGEAELAEVVSGVPYTLMNPIASVKVAKALLVILLKRSQVNAGIAVEVAEKEALAVVDGMPLSTLAGAFTFVPGDDDAPAMRAGDPEPELGAFRS